MGTSDNSQKAIKGTYSLLSIVFGGMIALLLLQTFFFAYDLFTPKSFIPAFWGLNVSLGVYDETGAGRHLGLLDCERLLELAQLDFQHVLGLRRFAGRIEPRVEQVPQLLADAGHVLLRQLRRDREYLDACQLRNHLRIRLAVKRMEPARREQCAGREASN